MPYMVHTGQHYDKEMKASFFQQLGIPEPDQEKATALGILCVALRKNTERLITVEQGTNTIVGADPERIKVCADGMLTTDGKSGRIPECWDGKAAWRIVCPY